MRRRTNRSHCSLTQALPALPAPHPLSAPDRPVSAQLSAAPGGFWCGEARRHDGHSDACTPHEVGVVVGSTRSKGGRHARSCRFRALKTASSRPDLTAPLSRSPRRCVSPPAPCQI